MVYRIYVEKKPGFDVEAEGLKNELVSLLGIQSLSGVRLLNRYDVEGIDEALFHQCATTVFSEPPVDNTYDTLPQDGGVSFAVEYLPGQFDQRADSAAECIQLISQGERPLVRSAKVYLLQGALTDEQLATALTEVKEAKELWASTGETEFKNIPADVQKQLQNKAAAAAKKVGATLTFDGKTISVVDAQGRTYSVLAKSNPIKPTGADYTMLIVVSAAVLGVLGSVVVISRKNKLTGDC